MSTFSKGIVFLALGLAALPVSAQSPLSQLLQSPTPANTSAKASDQLGRDTPYGTVFGFLQAAQSGSYSIAAQYLQMSPARRQSEGDALAMKLYTAMNSAFAGSLQSEPAAGRHTAGRRSAGPAAAGNHVGRRRGRRTRTGSHYRSDCGENLADLFRHAGESAGTLRSGGSAAGGDAAAQVDGEAPVCRHAALAMACSAIADSRGGGGGVAAAGAVANPVTMVGPETWRG